MATPISRQRIRSTDDLGELFKVTSKLYYKSNNKLYSDYGTYSIVNKGSRKAMVDWKPTLKLGPVPQNPMSVRSVRCNATSGTITNRSPYAGDPVYHVIDGPIAGFYFYDKGIRPSSSVMDVSAQTSFDLAVAQDVLQDALAKTADPVIALSEYFFEWRQVLSLLRNPLKTIMGFRKLLSKWFSQDAWIYSPRGAHTPGAVILSFRTRREIPVGRASSGLIKEASDRWLQYRYGIVPLVKDVTTVFNQFMSGKPYEAPIEFKRARHVLSSTTVVDKYQRNINATTVLFKGITVTEESYHAVQFFRPVADAAFSYQVGLHPRQVLSIIWNALPFSFVVDWAFCVDRWLKAIVINPYIELVGNCVTRRVKTHIDVILLDAWSLSYGYGVRSTIKNGSYGVLYRDEARREIALPSSKQIYSSMKWSSLKNVLTGLALIVNPALNKRR